MAQSKTEIKEDHKKILNKTIKMYSKYFIKAVSDKYNWKFNKKEKRYFMLKIKRYVNKTFFEKDILTPSELSIDRLYTIYNYIKHDRENIINKFKDKLCEGDKTISILNSDDIPILNMEISLDLKK